MNDNVEGWPWLPDKCPPDQYFIDFMIEHGGVEQTILHMGTGLHHRVGIECVKMGHRVIGVTVSREEYISRALRVDSDSYQVFYGNLNSLDLALLPPLDIVTLFHFGEMASMFGPASEDVLTKLMGHINEAGLVVFYNRSAEWGNSKPVVDIVANRRAGPVLRHVTTYKELEVYRCLA